MTQNVVEEDICEVAEVPYWRRSTSPRRRASTLRIELGESLSTLAVPNLCAPSHASSFSFPDPATDDQELLHEATPTYIGTTQDALLVLRSVRRTFGL